MIALETQKSSIEIGLSIPDFTIFPSRVPYSIQISTVLAIMTCRGDVSFYFVIGLMVSNFATRFLYVPMCITALSIAALQS